MAEGLVVTLQPYFILNPKISLLVGFLLNGDS